MPACARGGAPQTLGVAQLDGLNGPCRFNAGLDGLERKHGASAERQALGEAHAKVRFSDTGAGSQKNDALSHGGSRSAWASSSAARSSSAGV